MASEAPYLWERQEVDTEKSYAAFVAYRDLGRGRTLMAAAEKLGKSIHYHRHMQKWRQANQWDDRIRAYDVQMDRIETQARLRVDHEQLAKSRERRNTFLELLGGEIAQWFNGAKSRRIEAESNDKVYSPNAIELRRIASAVSVYMSESRAEYDDMPVQPVDVSLQGKIDLSNDLRLDNIGLSDLRSLAAELNAGSIEGTG